MDNKNAYEEGQRIGAAVGLLYVFRKPLAIFIGLCVLIMGPFVLIMTVAGFFGSAANTIQNPGLEARFSSEMRTTAEQGIIQLNESLKSGVKTRELAHYFTSDALSQIAQQLRKNGPTMEQDLTITKVLPTRFLMRGPGGYLDSRNNMSSVTTACWQAVVNGTQILTDSDGAQKSYTVDAEILMMLERKNDRWLIAQAGLSCAAGRCRNLLIDTYIENDPVFSSYCIR